MPKVVLPAVLKAQYPDHQRHIFVNAVLIH